MRAQTEGCICRARSTEDLKQPPRTRREAGGGFSSDPPKGTTPKTPCFETSGFHNCKRITFCCFKRPDVWEFVTAFQKTNIRSVSYKLSSSAVYEWRGEGEARLFPHWSSSTRKEILQVRKTHLTLKEHEKLTMFLSACCSSHCFEWFHKEYTRDCVGEGNSKSRGKFYGVFPAHTLPHLFLYNFHPFHWHLCGLGLLWFRTLSCRVSNILW